MTCTCPLSEAVTDCVAACDDALSVREQLALKLHPDKNSAPGAEDAFKAVGKAFAILSDPDKRAHYDRYGDSAPQSGGGSQAQQRRYQNDEVSPEDIFNMFFGGGFTNPHRGRRPQPAARHHSHQAQQGQPQQQQARGPLGQLAQFLPLLMILLLSLMSIPSAPDVPFRCVVCIDWRSRSAWDICLLTCAYYKTAACTRRRSTTCSARRRCRTW